MKTKIKKKMPKILPKGIIEKTRGRVSKTRVGPEVGSIPNVKTPGKIAKPAKIAIVKSVSPIVRARDGREVSFLI